MNNKAQQLTFTFLFFLFIFFLLITLFYDELLLGTKSTETHELMEREAQRGTESLLTAGYPSDWTVSDVKRIGLLTNGSLDEEKIKRLQELINQNYPESKNYLGIRHDYTLIITTDTTLVLGNPSINSEAELLASNPRQLALQKRIIPTNTNVASISLYIYRYVP
jgi:hypothetical protein